MSESGVSTLLPHYTACLTHYIEPRLYKGSAEEILETADLEVPGEDALSDDEQADEDGDSEAGSDDEEEKDVPVRLLDDFSVYDAATFELVSINELSGLGGDGFPAGRTYSASGEVRPWTEDPDDAPEDQVELEDEGLQSQYDRVKLPEITKFNIHYINHRPVIEQGIVTSIDGYTLRPTCISLR